MRRQTLLETSKEFGETEASCNNTFDTGVSLVAEGTSSQIAPTHGDTDWRKGSRSRTVELDRLADLLRSCKLCSQPLQLRKIQRRLCCVLITKSLFYVI